MNDLEGVPLCPYCNVDTVYRGFNSMVVYDESVADIIQLDVYICPRCKIARQYEVKVDENI